MTREIETWLSDSRVGNSSMVEHIETDDQSSLHCIIVSTDVTVLGVEMQAARCDVLKHDASLAACFFPLTNGAIIRVKVARIRDKG